MRNAPPEERRGAEEPQVLHDVHGLRVRAQVVEHRDMPDPQRQRMEQKHRCRRGEQCPQRRVSGGRRSAASARRRMRGRHRPQQRDQWSAGRDERRGDDHHQLVLHHVRRQPCVAPLVERRRQRRGERQPSRGERGASPDGCPPPAGERHSRTARRHKRRRTARLLASIEHPARDGARQNLSANSALDVRPRTAMNLAR